MREEGWDDPVRVASGGCGVATPTPVEAPIRLDGTYELEVAVVEAAYAALQLRRKEEAAAIVAAQSITVTLTRAQRDRLINFFGWDCSIPTAINQYLDRKEIPSTLGRDMLSSREMVDFRNLFVNAL